jgi:predicted DCC family thiol-disulfide oxidoreductase YuxK
MKGACIQNVYNVYKNVYILLVTVHPKEPWALICGMFIVSQPIRNKFYRSACENVSGQTTNNNQFNTKLPKINSLFQAKTQES